MKTIDDLENFFDLDLKIKDLIEKARPNIYDADSVELEKTLLKVFDVIRKSINEMLNFTLKAYENNINNKLNLIEKEILDCNYDVKKLLNVYEKYFYKMNPELKKSLQENIYGYGLLFNEAKPLDDCISINDILHYLHFHVINDTNLLKLMNKINEKGEHDKITLYGKESELADKVFKKLDISEETIIVSFTDHILIMVRDVGHALSIDAMVEGESVRVNYFIPKVCNVEKVNQLLGVNKLNLETDTAISSTSGEYIVSKDNFPESISEFIKSVPTDEDMKRDMSTIRF